MAPIELEYGRAIKRDDEEFFVHDDWLEATTVKPWVKEKFSYRVNWGQHSLRVEAEVECDSEDNGGFIRYKITQLSYRYLINKNLIKGKLSIPDGSQVSKVVNHPKEQRLIAGFRVKHVKLEIESTNGQ